MKLYGGVDIWLHAFLKDKTGQIHTITLLPPGKDLLVYRWPGGRVDPRDFLDAVEK